jgi:alanyl-tRNA synthetase
MKGTRVEELPERISNLLQKMKEMEKEFKAAKLAQAKARIPDLVKKADQVGSINVIAQHFEGELAVDELRALALDIRERVKTSIVVLSSVVDGRVVLVCTVDELARKSGHKAGELAKRASSILGGGGGGKDDFAQGGGADASKLDAAISSIKAELQKS